MQLAPSTRGRSLFVAGAALVVTMTAACSGSTAEASHMPYSDLVLRASQGAVEAVVQEGTTLTVTLSGEAVPRTVVVDERLNVRQELCTAAGAIEAGECQIRYEFVSPSTAGSLVGLLISSLLPVLLIGAFITYMMRRAAKARR